MLNMSPKPGVEVGRRESGRQCEAQGERRRRGREIIITMLLIARGGAYSIMQRLN